MGQGSHKRYEKAPESPGESPHEGVVAFLLSGYPLLPGGTRGKEGDSRMRGFPICQVKGEDIGTAVILHCLWSSAVLVEQCATWQGVRWGCGGCHHCPHPAGNALQHTVLPDAANSVEEHTGYRSSHRHPPQS